MMPPRLLPAPESLLSEHSSSRLTHLTRPTTHLITRRIAPIESLPQGHIKARLDRVLVEKPFQSLDRLFPRYDDGSDTFLGCR